MPYARVNGIKIYYETYGEGHPLVLIGGLGSEIQSWATQIPIYSKHFQVIVFYNRVVGKSMGGMIGQWLTIKYPEKVKKLVLGCASAYRDEVGNEILRIGRETATKIGMKAVWLTAIFWGYTREYIERNLSSIKEALAKVPENPEALTGYIRQSLACEGHNTTDLVGKIKCPTLVMLGEQDLIVSPKRSRELAELIPGAELKVFKEVGHGFWRERQEEVDRLVLDFLLKD